MVGSGNDSAMMARIQKRYFLFPFLLLTLYSCHRAPPLHHYARGGSLEHVQFMVNQGDNVNGVDEDGRTALIYAARYGQEEIIEYLLSNGADVNQQAQDGETPLIAASYGCHAKSAEILLAHRADYKMLYQHGQHGWTALMVAVSQGCTDIIQPLLGAGSDPNREIVDGHTPLLVAVANGHTSIVRTLLAAGADVNYKGKKGIAPLIVASHKGNLEIVKVLLNSGAAVDSRVIAGEDEAFRAGETALKVARRNHHSDIEQILIAAGATE